MQITSVKMGFALFFYTMKDQMDDQSWEEFQLIVDEEYADVVLDLLSDILPSGLAAERVYGDLFPHEIEQVKVPVKISAYLPKDGQLDPVKAEIKKALDGLSKDVPIPEPGFSSLLDQNWATVWQERYVPIPLGKNLIIVPSWLDNPQPKRVEIKIDPGMAFGSGTHPTTQLCLVLLESCLTEKPVREMLDIGCGSGILAIAGVKLGAEFVLGVDNDPDTIKVAAANARLNRVDDSIKFQHGSVDEVKRGQYKIDSASLVVANIIAPILTKLLEEGLEEAVLPGGTLILSGILEGQLPAICDLLEKRNLVISEKQQDGDWLALRADKPNG